MNNKSIKTWMRNNVQRFVDECNEVNCTAMVEAWDHEQANGEATLKDPLHIAWDVALDVAFEYECPEG